MDPEISSCPAYEGKWLSSEILVDSKVNYSPHFKTALWCTRTYSNEATTSYFSSNFINKGENWLLYTELDWRMAYFVGMIMWPVCNIDRCPTKSCAVLSSAPQLTLALEMCRRRSEKVQSQERCNVWNLLVYHLWSTIAVDIFHSGIEHTGIDRRSYTVV